MISRRTMSPRPAHEVPGTVIVDIEAALERIGGDWQLFRELSLIFVQDSPRLLAALSASVAARDRGQVERTAHGLKGIAANVGGIRVERVAAVVEDAARSGHLELAETGLETLSVELDRLISALRAMLVDSGDSDRPGSAQK